MNAKHTPGPWKIVQEHIDPEWHVITAYGGRIMCNIHVEPENAMDMANAELIARAPDLLAENERLRAALEDAEFLLRKIGINWKEAEKMADLCLRSASDAREALAKAKL